MCRASPVGGFNSYDSVIFFVADGALLCVAPAVVERAWEREDRDSARHHHRVKRNPGRARHTEVRDRARHAVRR